VNAGEVDAFLLVYVQHQTHSLVYLGRPEQMGIALVETVIHHFQTVRRVFGEHDHRPAEENRRDDSNVFRKQYKRESNSHCIMYIYIRFENPQKPKTYIFFFFITTVRISFRF